ncbi:MAG: hypothetical protein ACRDAI_02050 [Candidatus Rhabdochlamydia sp.]
MAILNNSCGIIAQSNAPLNVYTQLISFKPTISGSIEEGSGNYTTLAGTYYVIGKLIFININLTWTDHTGIGNMILTSLPVTCINQDNLTPTFSIRTEDILLPSGAVEVLGEVQINTQTASLYVTRSNAPIAPIEMSVFGTIRATFIYESI